MIYTIKVNSDKYIHDQSKLCGKYVYIYLTSNLEACRLVDYDTAKRYKTIIDKKLGERAKVWDGCILDGAGPTLETTKIVELEFREVEN
jgi:hypothetical protein